VPLGPLLEGLVRRTGGQVQPSSTLAELGVELAQLVGPQTAALAAQAECARFAPGPHPAPAHPARPDPRQRPWAPTRADGAYYARWQGAWRANGPRSQLMVPQGVFNG
jgi:hypothetical protein